MATDLPEHFQQRLHAIRTAGNPVHRDAAEAELHVMLALEQIKSATELADASKATADSLTRATWVLSGATIVLAISTIILVIVTATR